MHDIEKLKRARRVGLMDGAYYDHRALSGVIQAVADNMNIDEKSALHDTANLLHNVIGRKQHRLMTALDSAKTVNEIERITWRTTE